MTENSFFRWVWRYNALALAILVSFALFEFVPGALLRAFPPSMPAPRPVGLPEPTAPQPSESKYHFSLMYAHEGQRYGVLALELPPRVDAGFEPVVKGSLSAVRAVPTQRIVNYLFVDPSTGATRWLFPTHHQLVTDIAYLTEIPNSGNLFVGVPSPGPVRAVVYDVVPGGDTATPAAPAKKYQVFVSKTDGSEPTLFIDDVDEEPSTIQIDAAKIFVWYKSKGRSMVASFSLTDFKSILQKDVSGLIPK